VKSTALKLASAIGKASPLYDFWKSEQCENDEAKRLLKANRESPASYLFKAEPYKWENLYQSIIREIIKGDKDSIKGLKVLLSTINTEEKGKMLKILGESEILDREMLSLVDMKDTDNATTKKNIFRFARILFTIFFNPYGIELKREKNHIYEHTGAFFGAFTKAKY